MNTTLTINIPQEVGDIITESKNLWTMMREYSDHIDNASDAPFCYITDAEAHLGKAIQALSDFVGAYTKSQIFGDKLPTDDDGYIIINRNIPDTK